MLRIIVWRLLYHFLCLTKVCGYRGKPINYFAFGANLDPAVLKRRNIKPSGRREYLLQGYKLKFNHRVPFEGAGMASVDNLAGSNVPGIIYTIDQIDALRMDCMESHFILNRYSKVWLKDDSNIPFFFYKTNIAQEGLHPTKDYRDKLIAGYSLVNNVPPKFMNWLVNISFVDGFIAKEEPEFLIEDYNALPKVFRRPAVIYDKLCVEVFAFLIFKPSFLERFLRS